MVGSGYGGVCTSTSIASPYCMVVLYGLCGLMVVALAKGHGICFGVVGVCSSPMSWEVC